MRARRSRALVLAVAFAWWTAAAGTAAPAATEQGNTLLVADLKRLSPDEQMTFTALQGIVNRSSPRIYYVNLAGGQDYRVEPTSRLRLRDAVKLPTRRVADPNELLRRFRRAVRGLVVWDPALKVDTQNVATTMAGLGDLLPVSPAAAKVLARAPYRLIVRKDLRDEHFTGRTAAYEWALSELGPAKRFGLLAWLGGTRNFVPVGQPGLRDFIVARRGIAFEVEPITEAPLVRRILDAFPAGTYVYGYPFVDDVVYSTTAGGPVVQAPGLVSGRPPRET
jgi:hypothetical protein